jgi:hypothetical protein
MRLFTALLLLLTTIVAAGPPKPLSPAHVVADIKQVNLMKNLNRLATIAAKNGGNRAFGLPGYRASVEFVVERLQKFKRTVNVEEQEFEALFAMVDDIKLNEVGEEDVYVFGLTYSPSTLAEGITGELALGPDGLDGCSASGYEGKDVKDRIVLVQRFRCPDGTTLGGRVRAAVAYEDKNSRNGLHWAYICSVLVLPPSSSITISLRSRLLVLSALQIP